jgi:hypothetical protein
VIFAARLVELAVLAAGGTGSPLASVAKSMCATLSAGSPAPMAFSVTSFVREAPIASEPAPVRSFQNNEPEPMPSGVVVA